VVKMRRVEGERAGQKPESHIAFQTQITSPPALADAPGTNSVQDLIIIEPRI
jgi:hypothetical protein